jgi:hypothetical protein
VEVREQMEDFRATSNQCLEVVHVTSLPTFLMSTSRDGDAGKLQRAPHCSKGNRRPAGGRLALHCLTE